MIGGGLLGLEAARAVANRGIAVTVVHLGARLMERQLDATAGRMLERALRGQGIDVLCERMTTAIHDDRVELHDGEAIPADLVVIAAGVVPEVELAKRMGVQIDRGVLVDDSLRTNLPGVWAVGECAEHRGQLVGLVAPALEMARAAAADIAGSPAAYLPGPVATRLKVAGIDLFSMGELDGDDEVVALDTRAGHYRREVYDGRGARRLDRARRPAGDGRDARGAGLRLQRRHAQRDPRLRRLRPRGRAPADARLHRLRLLRRRGAGATGRGGRGRVPGRTGRRRESDRSARARARGSPRSRSSVARSRARV